MTTIILSLGALTIAMGYVATIRGREIGVLREALETREQSFIEHYTYRAKQDKEKHLAEKENWKQTSSAWILEKEEMIERLEREKFNQLHELALMLNDSYYVDEIILEKAEKFDWLVNDASREQKRNFIKGYIIK